MKTIVVVGIEWCCCCGGGVVDVEVVLYMQVVWAPTNTNNYSVKQVFHSFPLVVGWVELFVEIVVDDGKDARHPGPCIVAYMLCCSLDVTNGRAVNGELTVRVCVCSVHVCEWECVFACVVVCMRMCVRTESPFSFEFY